MIAIVNIDSNQRDSGKHFYEIRINKKRITNFYHNREDPLSICLKKASKAVKELEKK